MGSGLCFGDGVYGVWRNLGIGIVSRYLGEVLYIYMF